MAQGDTIGKLVVQVLMDASGYDTELVEVERKTSNLGKLFERIADQIGSMFVQAAKAATAAAAGLAAASTVVGANFEQAVAKVAAVKGLERTSDEFARLEEEARRLGASTSFSASQAAAGMEELARAGMSTDDIIASSQKVLELAAGSSISLADAAAIAAATMKQFGLEAEDAGRITDVLTATTQNSLFGMRDLAEAMKYAGTAGSAFGMSIEETSAAVAQFRDLGMEGSMAGTNFREALSSMAKPTATARAALHKYGLTVEDINPETRSFRDIMIAIGEAGLTTADALEIFGQRAGANVKQIAEKMAESSDAFDDLLSTLENAAGTTASTYATMTNTLLGRFNEAKSAAEEFLIILFETFGTPLKDVMDSVVRLIRMVGEEVAYRSGQISGDMESTLGGIASFIDENAAGWAHSIANIIEGAAKFTSTLQTSVIPALGIIIPLVDDIAIILGTVWATQRAMAFAAFITGVVVPAINATTFSLSGMATALAGATGGLSALAAGLAVVVTGLAVLTANLIRARNETKSLAEAQAEAAGKISDQEQRLQAAMGHRLRVAQDIALAEKERLAASGELTAADQERLDHVLQLTEAEAWRAHKQGEILTDEEGRIHRVRDLLRGEEADRTRVTKALEHYQSVLEDAKRRASEGDLAERTLAQHEVEVFTSRIQGIRGAIADWRAEQSRASNEGERQGRRLAGLAGSLEVAAGATDDLAESQREAIKAAEGLSDTVAALRDELAMVGADEDTRAELVLARRREAVKEAAKLALQQEGLTADEIEEIHRDREEALRLIARLGTEQRKAEQAEIERQAEQRRAEEAERAEQQRQDMVSALYEQAVVSRLTESERLERRYRNEVMPALEGASAAKRLAIQKHFYDQIEYLREQEEGEQVGFFGRVEQAASAAWGAMRRGANAVRDAMGGIVAIGDSVLGFMERLTGFSFSLADGMGAVTSALQEAAQTEDGGARVLSEGGVATIATNAAKDFVDGLVANAQTFIASMLYAIPSFIAGLVEGIPAIVDEMIVQIPRIVQQIAVRLPMLVDTLVEQLPKLIDALIAALPGIASTLTTLLAEQVPRLIVAVVDALPGLIAALVEAVNQIITGVMEALPGLVTYILESVPKIVQALLEGIPVILEAVLSGIPDIIRALIRGTLSSIPTIITAVINSIPGIVLTVTNAIPEIVMAVVTEIPTIIEAIVQSIPTIIIAIVQALPTIIVALVGMIPELFFSIIAEFPRMIAMLFKQFFVELPRQIPKIIGEMVKALGQAIIGAFRAVGDAIRNFFGNIFRKKNRDEPDGGMAYSGINYVPATMRMTLHPGEAVVPASRNPARVHGVDPALAGAAAFQGGGRGGGGKVEIGVSLGGEVVDRVLVDAANAGKAPGITRLMRAESGTKVGYDAGNFNRWNK